MAFGNTLMLDVKNMIMKNPIDYLWYKIYRWLKFVDDGNAITDVACVGGTLFLNFLSIYLLMFGYLNTFTYILAGIFGLILSTPYQNKKNGMKILRRYIRESKETRIRGNAIVAIYVILSFAMPYIIIAFKNGRLLAE